MTSVSEEEIQRLANRLAMLVSDDGEADNAGRAVGSLARRLGLSGGQLKAIFMAGVESAGPTQARLAARIQALEGELADTQERLRRAEASGRVLQRHRDALRDEIEAMHARQGRRRSTGRLRFALGGLLVLVAGAAGWMALYGPPLNVIDRPPVTADGAPVYRSATIREPATVVRRGPDIASEALATLDVGAKLTVHRTLWHNLEQWVEVEWQGQTGYVPSTAVDLS